MWTSDITSIVVTRVQAIVRKKLKTKYPNINFTTSSVASTEPKFPTVYIKRLQGAERGQDLEGKSVNAILCSFQVEVTSKGSDTVAQEVADEVCKVFKTMAFQIIGEPFPDNTNAQTGVFRNVARYQRIIGYGDII